MDLFKALGVLLIVAVIVFLFLFINRKKIFVGNEGESIATKVAATIVVYLVVVGIFYAIIMALYFGIYLIVR